MKQIIVHSTKYGNKICTVDDEDYDLLSKTRWILESKNGKKMYALSGDRSKTRMHRLITGADIGFVVDHKDGNGLNNCRSNLRICTNTDNSRNTKVRGNNTTGYKGVVLRTWGRYQAQIMHFRRCHYLGLFDSPEDAAMAYNKKAIELFGEFANLNEVKN